MYYMAWMTHCQKEVKVGYQHCVAQEEPYRLEVGDVG